MPTSASNEIMKYSDGSPARNWIWSLICILLLLIPVPGRAQSSTLNLSRDLIRLNISSSNLAPNQSSLDAGPLLVKGVNYAKTHGIGLVTVDPGAYYFLTLQFPDRHVNLSQVNNMTIDFQGSDLYLGNVQRLGIVLSDSTNTVLKNFTIDFMQLPFTQLSVISVDPAQRQVQFRVPAGWQHPSVFNSPQNAFGLAEEIWVFVFRNGQPAPGMSRLQARRPFDQDRFTLIDQGFPWEATEVIARIKPGDTAVLTARGAGEPVLVSRGDGITLQNIKIFSSGINGLAVLESARTLVERVYVMPRPGTERLISTNADGITLWSQWGENNTIRLSRSIRTLDDGFSPHSLIYGTVQQKISARTLSIQRQFTIRFPNGVPAVFQSRTDGQILGSATVIAQRPPPTQSPVNGESIQVDFDRDLPDLAAGTAVYSSEPSQRGNNTVLERNAVQDQVFARGISLWGLMNSTVRGNYISGSHTAAIFGTHRLSTVDWMSPPLENVTIANNVIDGAITNVGGSVLAKMAGIQLLAQKADFQPMLVSPHRNIQIINNFIGESARSGIRVENVTASTVSGNFIVDPNINPYIDGDTFEPYKTEFLQPLIIKTSQAVTTTNNLIETNATRIAVTDTSSRRLSAYAPGSHVLLNAIGIDSLSNPSAAMTDADGNSLPVSITARAPGALTVQLPTDSALGGAVLNVTSGNIVLRGTLFIDSEENFPLPWPTLVSQSDCLFSWAERIYPSLFAPAGATTNALAAYYYRYYSQTHAYLATSSADNHLYYLGPLSGNSILDAGAVSGWLSTAGCQ